MTTYQLVPYLVSVHIARKQDETRPLDDIAGGKEDLATELAGLLAAHKGGLRVEAGVSQTPAQLQVDSVQVGQRTLYTVIAPGRSGVQSTIRRLSGETVDRNFADHELIGVRHVLFYPPNGHRAVLFAERVGNSGAITGLIRLVKAAWKTRFPETVISFEAAMSEQALAGTLAMQPIKQLVLTRPTAPNGSLMIGGQSSTVTTAIRPPRGKKWKAKDFSQTGDDSTETVLSEHGVLSAVAPILRPGVDPDKAAQAMIDEGWQVAVTLKLKGGTERTVNVGSTTAVTMSLQIIEGENEPDHRPDDAEIADASRKVISDGLLEPWDIHPTSASACTWSDDEIVDPGDWKAVWDVVQPPPDPAGSVH